MAVPAAALHLRHAVPRHAERSAPAWRRNLAVLWLVEFIAVFGFNFATPFLSIYLRSDLGLASVSDLALWTGLFGGAVGIAMAVASPIWGVIADRRGRKVMLLRAIAGGAVSVGLMAVARTPGQLFALCVVQGASSGTVAAATALVAAETPRRHVAHALSLLTSAVALAGALAPVAGGLLVGVLGLRPMFAVSGLLLFAALVAAALLVRESPRTEPRLGRKALPHRGALAGLARGTLIALAVLVGAQALMQFSASAVGSLAVLKVMRVDPVHAGTIAGMAYGVAGLATTIASLAYEPVVRRWGYRRLAGAAALLAGATVLAAAVAGSTWLLVLAVGAGGFFFGALNPALYAMIGLEAPQPSHGTVYGVSASALAIGAGAGPAVTGALAAVADVQSGLLAAAVVAVVLAALLWLWAREPGGRAAPAAG
jgi:MFS transporter, DHA1 family, multidrug resistance protein